MTQAELLLTLRQELAGYPALGFALLFGSWAREQTRPGSDVDVAIMPLEDWPLAAELDLQGKLARAVRASVDLVRLDRAAPLLAWEVVSKGLVIVDPANHFARYQARVALEHADAAPALARAALHYARRLAELGPPTT